MANPVVRNTYALPPRSHSKICYIFKSNACFDQVGGIFSGFVRHARRNEMIIGNSTRGISKLGWSTRNRFWSSILAVMWTPERLRFRWNILKTHLWSNIISRLSALSMARMKRCRAKAAKRITFSKRPLPVSKFIKQSDIEAKQWRI